MKETEADLLDKIERIRAHLLADESVRERISRRAYNLYQNRGGEHGRHFDDWLHAENEILVPLIEQELERFSGAQAGAPAVSEKVQAKKPAAKKPGAPTPRSPRARQAKTSTASASQTRPRRARKPKGPP